MPPLRLQLLRTAFRYAFHVAACGSTLVLVVGLLGWGRSYYRVDTIKYEGTTLHCGMGSGTGRVLIHSQNFEMVPQAGFSHDSTATGPKDRAGWSYAEGWESRAETRSSSYVEECRIGGISLQRGRMGTASPLWAWFLVIPYSYLTLLAALLPALWLRRFLRRRRQARLARPGFPVAPAGPAAGRAIDAGVSPADAEATDPSTEPGAASAAGDGSAAASRDPSAAARDSAVASCDSAAASGDSPAGPRESLTVADASLPASRAAALAGGASDAGRGGPSSEPQS